MIKFKPIQHDVTRYFRRIPQVLSKHPEVIAAYIFGSYANGDVGPLSDVDIAYLFKPEALSKDYFDLELQIGAELSQALQTDEVDHYLLNKAPLPFQYEVITKGKLIYCRDPAAQERFERAVRESYEQRKEAFTVTRVKLLKTFADWIDE